ncbi:uncharacterized protein [Drosophila kikkawai]|uniref:Uncharacterized protein n=1 Tax=Drosophila kikkawai TaxID=30033 RepID=A0A6P4I965_DROKI|nr:uncharacterized protein LOC108072610 [Drosophila kikkawai]
MARTLQLIRCDIQLCLAMFIVFVKAERSIKFIAGESRFKREYFKNFTFTIRDDQIFLDMYLRKPLVKGWRARLDFRLHVGNSKTFQSLFSTNIDVWFPHIC